MSPRKLPELIEHGHRAISLIETQVSEISRTALSVLDSYRNGVHLEITIKGETFPIGVKISPNQ